MQYYYIFAIYLTRQLLMKKRNITAILCIALTACITTLSAQKRMTTQEYIERYKDIAIEHQDIYGIPASIKLAQGLLESDCGNSRLATKANNHFGIKCKSDWTGGTISHDDDAKGECFRSYETDLQSYSDHSQFLDRSERYQSLFDLDITDYKGWAYGLKDAGYATNPKYGELLVKIIEDNKLYIFDTEDYARWNNTVEVQEPDNTQDNDYAYSAPEDAAFSPATDKIDVDNYLVSVRTVAGYPVYYNNGSEFIVAKEGDTYIKLAGVTGISEKKLRKFNDNVNSLQPKTGEQVYIKAKGNKATNGKLIHVVKSGDTMHSISQIYGIKLNKLTSINHRTADSKLTPGQQIRLM